MKTSLTGGARWSPDGRQIAFLSTVAGQQELYTLPIAGGAPRRLTDNTVHDTAPSYSHDGKWIYFGSNRVGDFQIWKMPSSGGEAVQITKKGGYAPLESPDGQYIYYVRRNRLEGVWRAPAGGGEETPVIPSVAAWGNFAMADRGIYFVPAEKREIQFFDFATHQVKTVWKPEKPPAFGLDVTHDGRSLFYSRTDRDINELILVENFK
jgi:dipeptidyl aminopeptidase/acylaminoacyl peptidase